MPSRELTELLELVAAGRAAMDGRAVGIEEQRACVTESRASRTPGRGVVTTTNRVRNQRGEEVLVHMPTRLIRGRGDA